VFVCEVRAAAQRCSGHARRTLTRTLLSMARSETLREALTREPVSLVPTAGHAAVSAIFTADLELLLLRRAEHPRDPWSGHLGFPGGRVEPGEGPLEAAVRETFEEVGVELAAEHLLGRLDDLAAVGG